MHWYFLSFSLSLSHSLTLSLSLSLTLSLSPPLFFPLYFNHNKKHARTLITREINIINYGFLICIKCWFGMCAAFYVDLCV